MEAVWCSVLHNTAVVMPTTNNISHDAEEPNINQTVTLNVLLESFVNGWWHTAAGRRIMEAPKYVLT